MDGTDQAEQAVKDRWRRRTNQIGIAMADSTFNAILFGILAFALLPLYAPIVYKFGLPELFMLMTLFLQIYFVPTMKAGSTELVSTWPQARQFL